MAPVRFVHAGPDANWEEIAEWHASSNTMLRRFVPGPAIDEPVAYVEGAAIFYFHADRLGNIVATANASGALADRYVYTPYGVEHPLIGSAQPLRYNARRYDPESALYHYRARYYAPVIGRFIQTDPILYADQMNLYAYVGNDPLNARDPSGRWQDDAERERGYAPWNPFGEWNPWVPGTEANRQWMENPLGPFLGYPESQVAPVAPAENVGLAEANKLRAAEVHGVLTHEIERRQRTTAVLTAITPTGETIVIVGSGGRDLTPAQRSALRPGEVAALFPTAHAEITVLAEAYRREATPVALGIHGPRPI